MKKPDRTERILPKAKEALKERGTVYRGLSRLSEGKGVQPTGEFWIWKTDRSAAVPGVKRGRRRPKNSLKEKPCLKKMPAGGLTGCEVDIFCYRRWAREGPTMWEGDHETLGKQD